MNNCFKKVEKNSMKFKLHCDISRNINNLKIDVLLTNKQQNSKLAKLVCLQNFVEQITCTGLYVQVVLFVIV